MTNLISIDPGLVNLGVYRIIGDTCHSTRMNLLDFEGQSFTKFKKNYPGTFKNELISNIKKKFDLFHHAILEYDHVIIEGQHDPAVCFIESAIHMYFALEHPRTKVYTVCPVAVGQWFKKKDGVTWKPGERSKKKELTLNMFKEKCSISNSSSTYDEADAYLNFYYAIHKFADLTTYRISERWVRNVRPVQCGDNPVSYKKRRHIRDTVILIDKKPRNDADVHEH